MAGKGPAPKDPADRRRRNKPAGGEWASPPGEGWRYGEIPKAPTGLKPASRRAWRTWFCAWFAAWWTPDDLPGLETVILLFDQVQRGEYHRAAELRLEMDGYGITPKGQQQLRWKRPEPKKPESEVPRRAVGEGRYGHLRSL
jgi:hypothetical protein